MFEQALPVVFRLIAEGLIAWTILLILRKILRRAGVIPYPPFKSRAEYLEAALEMNLEDFIGRAKATPRSVIQKPPAPKFKMPDLEKVDLTSFIIDTIKEIKKDMEGYVSIFTRTSGQIGGAGAVGAAGAVGILGVGSGSGAATASKPKWFRVKETGELVRACSCGQDCSCYQTFTDPLRLILPSSIEPACPREGEWWQKQPCPKSHGKHLDLETAWIPGPTKWHYSANAAYQAHRLEIDAALCGCLEPVNYGKGNEKSGVA